MARNTQRFRRIGQYTTDDLLKDLRDFEAEMLGVKDGVDSGALVGPPGPAGVKGESGERSTIPGPAGDSGLPGADGNDGLSAYDIAVNNGFEGTEAKWLDSLVAQASSVEDWGLIPADYGSISVPAVYLEDYGDLT